MTNSWHVDISDHVQLDSLTTRGRMSLWFQATAGDPGQHVPVTFSLIRRPVIPEFLIFR